VHAPTLHLIDLDNLVGGPWNDDLVDAALDELLEAANHSDGDHVVVGAEAALAKTAFFRLPVSARMLVGRGPDGADKALVEHLSPEHIERRYERLVIASGDGRFADLAEQVQSKRSMVEVYARPRTISQRLKSVTRWIELAGLAELIGRCRG
jgi:hypothetical protein